MKGLLMVAGKGTRLHPLTLDRSKCMLPVGGRPIMEYSLDTLVECGVDEIVIVVRKDRNGDIIDAYDGEYKGVPLRFVEQKRGMEGTGAAALSALEHINDDMIILAGDIYVDKEDVKRAVDKFLKTGSDTLLLKEITNPTNYGVAIVDEDRLVELVEKPKDPLSNLINASVYVVRHGFDEYLKKIQPSPRGEYEITDAINRLAKDGWVNAVKIQGYWNDIGTPWSLLDANEYIMKNRMGRKIDGMVKGSVIEGNVIIEEGALVRDSIIEGPAYIARGAKVGPHAHIRGATYIGRDCEIGGFTIVKNSIVMDRTKAKHLTYIGDSIVGSDCNFGSAVQIANLRFDRENVKMFINGEKKDSQRRKMGAVVGSNVNLGVNACVMPGRKIGMGAVIGPGTIVTKDVDNHQRIFVKQEWVVS